MPQELQQELLAPLQLMQSAYDAFADLMDPATQTITLASLQAAAANAALPANVRQTAQTLIANPAIFAYMTSNLDYTAGGTAQGLIQAMTDQAYYVSLADLLFNGTMTGTTPNQDEAATIAIFTAFAPYLFRFDGQGGWSPITHASLADSAAQNPLLNPASDPLITKAAEVWTGTSFDAIVDITGFQPLPATGTIPDRRGLLAVEDIPHGDITVSAYNGDISVEVSGGIWAHAKQLVTPISSFGATEPIIARQDLLLESTAYAQKLAAGATVQSLLGSNPTADQTAAMQDALELLGISNRQIAIYAKAASNGWGDSAPYTQSSKDAEALLAQAGRMRTAIDAGGAGEAGAYSLTIVGEKFGSTTLPDDFSFNGVIRAIQQGTGASRQFWLPKVAARDMIYSDYLFNSNDAVVFPKHIGVWDTYGYNANIGAQDLKTDTITLNALPGSALEEKAGQAANDLAAIPGDSWTDLSVTQAYYAADILTQAIGPSVTTHLQAIMTAHPGDNSNADLEGFYLQAVNAALADHGITNITADQIGEKLLEAYLSGAFNTAIGGNQDYANRALSILAFFDPKAAQRAEVYQEFTVVPDTSTDAGKQTAALQYINRKMLYQLANSAPPTNPSYSQDVKDATGSVIAQWAIASYRWFAAAAGKAQISDAAMQAFENYAQEAAQHAVPTTDGKLLFKDAQGHNIGTSLDDVIKWAANKARITTNEGFNTWLNTQGKAFASKLDKYGVGIFGALGSLAVRAYRLANGAGYRFDKTTTAQLVASSVADVMVITEWAASASRLGGHVSTAIANLEDVIFKKIGNIPDWFAALRGLQDFGFAPAGPITSAGRFFNWAISQAGGFGNLIYGGFNIAQGVRQVAQAETGPDIARGVLTAVTGTVDFLNGYAQLARAASGQDLSPFWRQVGSFGYTYPISLQIATRLLAAAAGATNAGIVGATG